MQITSSSILGTPSNLNGSPANSPAATTVPRGVRAPATDRRLAPVAAVLPVRTPDGFRFMPPRLCGAPARDSSGAGVAVTPSTPVIGERHATMANVGTLTVAKGVPPVLDPVQRANTFAKDRPSKFGRVHVSTSVSSLIAVLAKQSFVGVDNPNLAQPEPIVVIPESKFRALLMKALAWFIDREYTNLDGAVVVFVGKKIQGNAPTTGLALPLAAVHKLADEFDTGGRDREFDLECEESGIHPLHVGSFCVEHSHWAVPIAGFLGIAGSCALVLLYAFLRDVAKELMFLPPTL